MRSVSSFLIIALVVCSVAAQKGKGLPAQIVPIPSKAQPTTLPKAIDESNHKKECPVGFQFIGKQCVKTLTAAPSKVCPPGTVEVDGKCAKYWGKESECPIGYVLELGGCIKRNSAPQELFCPPGFILAGKDKCIKKVPLPELKECPAGTLIKGDNCVKLALDAPEYVCPPGYTLVGKRCQRESTFDCTPARKPTPPAEEKKGEILRLRQPGKGKDGNLYHLPASAPTVEEYVIQETCKRIVTEDARPICSKDGNFNGKMCERDVIVPGIIKPGGFRDVIIPADLKCPESFLESGPLGECLATQHAPLNFFCPPGTLDLGDKCVIWSEPKIICPEGFYLDGKICTKTIFAAPLVEFTVTYACTGKDCGRH